MRRTKIYNPNHKFLELSDFATNLKTLSFFTDENNKRISNPERYSIMAILNQANVSFIETEFAPIPNNKYWTVDLKVTFTDGDVIVVEINGGQHFFESNYYPSIEDFTDQQYRFFAKQDAVKKLGFGCLNINMLIPGSPFRHKLKDRCEEQVSALKALFNNNTFKLALNTAKENRSVVNFNIKSNSVGTIVLRSTSNNEFNERLQTMANDSKFELYV